MTQPIHEPSDYSQPVEFEHVDANGVRCAVTHKQWAYGQTIMLHAIAAACPVCGLVIKNRFGRRGVYNTQIVWHGRLPHDYKHEFKVTRAKEFYTRPRNGEWELATGADLDAITRHVKPLLGDDHDRR